MTFLLPLLLACHPDTSKPDSEAPVVADQDKDGYTVEEGDCNDADASIHGSATELCDGVDNNCDGAVDEGTTSLYYTDSDGDGYGDPATGAPACEAETGQVSIALDCDDADNATYPGAPESCTEAVDRNCDGATGRTDADGDGFAACEECDDSNPAVNPGATESCDPANIDEDCNGLADDDDPAVDPASQTASYLDLDADGYGAQQLLSCDEIGTALAGDCDDGDANFYP
ncbi:MAG TPA: putative metal-binding motif-containing protein, partial [Myxococcota bacterium]|nr:putative metal-binding motif-containing protein [Myxococcota bacterium]